MGFGIIVEFLDKEFVYMLHLICDSNYNEDVVAGYKLNSDLITDVAPKTLGDTWSMMMNDMIQGIAKLCCSVG